MDDETSLGVNPTSSRMSISLQRGQPLFDAVGGGHHPEGGPGAFALAHYHVGPLGGIGLGSLVELVLPDKLVAFGRITLGAFALCCNQWEACYCCK